jgi:hypothetical protein
MPTGAVPGFPPPGGGLMALSWLAEEMRAAGLLSGYGYGPNPLG